MNKARRESPSGESPSGAVSPSPSPERRLLFWVLAFLVVLVAVSVVVALFDTDAAVDSDSPEGVVRDYLSAVIDGERSRARTFLHSELDGCDDRFPFYVGDYAYRIALVDTRINGDQAWVTVSVTEMTAGLFGDYGSRNHEFGLVATPDGWRIADQDWPWYECSFDRAEMVDRRPDQ